MRPGLRDSSFAGAARSLQPPVASTDFDPTRMLSTLDEFDVQFVLIGGMAAVLHGDVGVTVDLHVVPNREDENLERLARALCALGARIRTESEPEGLPFDCSAAFFRHLSPDAMVNMTTKAGDLDVTFRPSGTEGFADLRRDALEIEAGDRLTILVASLEDVIRSKEAAGREKDRLALPRLRRLLDRLRADE
jgi:hypothetical protein